MYTKLVLVVRIQQFEFEGEKPEVEKLKNFKLSKGVSDEEIS